MKTKQLIIISFLVFVVSAAAPAAVVYMKDGSLLKGTVVSATVLELELYTGQSTMRIATDRISHIDYNADETTSTPPAPQPSPRILQRSIPLNNGNNQHMFSFNFGILSPLSRIDFSSIGGGSGYNGGSGILVGVQYLYNLSPYFGTGFDINYVNRAPLNDHGLIPNAATDIYGNTLLTLGLVKLSFTDQRRIKPYLLAGIGTNHTSETIDATPKLGYSWSDTDTEETRTLVSDANWGLASTVRLGADFGNTSVFSFEIGWTGYANGSYYATAQGRNLGLNSVSGTIDNVTIATRWGWKF